MSISPAVLLVTLPAASTDAYCVEKRLHVAETAVASPTLQTAVQTYGDESKFATVSSPLTAMSVNVRFANVTTLLTVFVTPPDA